MTYLLSACLGQVLVNIEHFPFLDELFPDDGSMNFLRTSGTHLPCYAISYPEE